MTTHFPHLLGHHAPSGVDLNPYDQHTPRWVKGLAGGIAALVLIPSIAFIAVANLAGIKEIMVSSLDAYMKAQVQQLESSQQVVVELQALRVQTAAWNAASEARLAKLEEVVAKQSTRLEAVDAKLGSHLKRVGAP